MPNILVNSNKIGATILESEQLASYNKVVYNRKRRSEQWLAVTAVAMPRQTGSRFVNYSVSLLTFNKRNLGIAP